MNPQHKHLSLEQAEYWKHQGLMSEDEFEAYFHEWSQAARFGNAFCRCAVCQTQFPNRFLPEAS